MKFFLVLGLLLNLNFAFSNDADLTKQFEKSDNLLILQSAKKDLKLIEKYRKMDELQKELGLVRFRHNDCDDDDTTGSSGCWDACSKGGWSVSYCASTCGVSTSSSSKGCWATCTKGGWSVSYCSSTCGTSTNGGSKGCWDACSKGGWSVSYCASSCGVSTNGGSKGCWDACSNGGWSVSYCASTCGKN